MTSVDVMYIQQWCYLLTSQRHPYEIILRSIMPQLFSSATQVKPRLAKQFLTTSKKLVNYLTFQEKIESSAYNMTSQIFSFNMVNTQSYNFSYSWFHLSSTGEQFIHAETICYLPDTKYLKRLQSIFRTVIISTYTDKLALLSLHYIYTIA